MSNSQEEAWNEHLQTVTKIAFTRKSSEKLTLKYMCILNEQWFCYLREKKTEQLLPRGLRNSPSGACCYLELSMTSSFSILYPFITSCDTSLKKIIWTYNSYYLFLSMTGRITGQSLSKSVTKEDKMTRHVSSLYEKTLHLKLPPGACFYTSTNLAVNQ